MSLVKVLGRIDQQGRLVADLPWSTTPGPIDIYVEKQISREDYLKMLDETAGSCPELQVETERLIRRYF